MGRECVKATDRRKGSPEPGWQVSVVQDAESIEGVEINRFKGPHPAGNVGIQIHKLDPINKGDMVWTVKPQDVVAIGRLFKTGKYDPSVVVALTGSRVKKPSLFQNHSRNRCAPLLENQAEGRREPGDISGNVLNGKQVDPEKGYVGFSDSQVTVIPEGNYYELFGWIMPGFRKFSVSRSFASTWLAPEQEIRRGYQLPWR